MKRLLLALVLIFLISGAGWAKMVSVVTDEAVMREGAGYAYKVKMGLVEYYPLKVLDKLGNWYKVRDWMNNTGWVRKNKISDTPTCIIRKMRINMRSGPSTRYRKIMTLYKGFILKVDRKKSTRYWIRGQIVDPKPKDPKKPIYGWVHRRLVWGH